MSVGSTPARSVVHRNMPHPVNTAYLPLDDCGNPGVGRFDRGANCVCSAGHERCAAAQCTRLAQSARLRKTDWWCTHGRMSSTNRQCAAARAARCPAHSWVEIHLRNTHTHRHTHTGRQHVGCECALSAHATGVVSAQSLRGCAYRDDMYGHGTTHHLRTNWHGFRPATESSH